MIKVLYVEDDLMTGRIFDHLFSGFTDTELTIFTSGYEAIAHLQDYKYDLIILDLGLNDISGLEIADILRNDMNLSTPIILTSAHIESDMESPLVTQIVEKPLTSDHIQELLSTYTEFSVN